MAQWNTCRGGANSTVFNKSAHIEIAFLLQHFINDAIMSLFVFITFYLNSNSSVTGKWQMGSPVADIRCRMWSEDLQMSDDNLMTSPDDMMMTWYPGPGTADLQTDQIEIAIRCQLSLPGSKYNAFLRIEDRRFVYQIKKLVEPHSPHPCT